MSAKQTKIRALLKENQQLKEENKKLDRKIDILMGDGDRRMFEIDNQIDNIEQRFSKDFIWNKLTPNPDGQIKFLERTLKEMREITRHNQDEPKQIRTFKELRKQFT